MAKRNVFLALGFEPEDAAVSAVRADLADAVATFFAGKTHGYIKERIGLPQSTVSQLMNGKVDHISVERLMRAMVRAGIPGFATWPSADTASGGLLSTDATTQIVNSSFRLTVDPRVSEAHVSTAAAAS